VADELPPDPDLDDLPEELRERNDLRIAGRDPETGEVYSQPISREELGRPSPTRAAAARTMTPLTSGDSTLAQPSRGFRLHR
jgi:hypothetical protein